MSGDKMLREILKEEFLLNYRFGKLAGRYEGKKQDVIMKFLDMPYLDDCPVTMTSIEAIIDKLYRDIENGRIARVG